ncbi:MAG: TIGR04283 family arsenosugar biosynthesis glycosyltransferase [Nitrospiraceae bacterium]|nr:TIGR04283 family arsenosugar biosynthesis glycosyltransferase [Nitrospiraceae bacterium]
MDTPIHISVIIPCFHDEVRLGRLLPELRSFGSGIKEIFVVDAAASSECQELCQKYEADYLTSPPCRGVQLRTGAARATAEVLWFLHADARFSGNPLAAIDQAFKSRGAIGGFFRFRFAGPRPWPASLLERAIALRVRWGTPYGDQGIFMSQKAYHQSGGFPEWPLFEEVPLVRKLRQQGRFIDLKEVILVDPRKWDREGWWRRTWNNRLLATAFALGIPPHRLAVLYNHPLQTFRPQK